MSREELEEVVVEWFEANCEFADYNKNTSVMALDGKVNVSDLIDNVLSYISYM